MVSYYFITRWNDTTSTVLFQLIFMIHNYNCRLQRLLGNVTQLVKEQNYKVAGYGELPTKEALVVPWYEVAVDLADWFLESKSWRARLTFSSLDVHGHSYKLGRSCTNRQQKFSFYSNPF